MSTNSRDTFVTVSQTSFAEPDKTRINLSNIAYMAPMDDGTTVVHFVGGGKITVKEHMDVILGGDQQRIDAQNRVADAWQNESRNEAGLDNER
jgi:hypothetical protein